MLTVSSYLLWSSFLETKGKIIIQWWILNEWWSGITNRHWLREFGVEFQKSCIWLKIIPKEEFQSETGRDVTFPIDFAQEDHNSWYTYFFPSWIALLMDFFTCETSANDTLLLCWRVIIQQNCDSFRFITSF